MAAIAIAEKAMATGHLGEAQDAYIAILEREPNSFDALFGMAMLAEGAGDNGASLHYHSFLAQAHPRNARALFALGNFYAKRFDFVRARANYRLALELAPTWAGVWNNLGNVEKYMGNLKEGIACYDRAVAADPDNAALESAALHELDLAVAALLGRTADDADAAAESVERGAKRPFGDWRTGSAPAFTASWTSRRTCSELFEWPEKISSITLLC